MQSIPVVTRSSSIRAGAVQKTNETPWRVSIYSRWTATLATMSSEMTPAQEMCNAVSMVIPAAILMARGLHSVPMACLQIGTLVHLPSSFLYHLNASRRCYTDRIDNRMRRIDQTMQHVAGTLFSFAISRSAGYTLLICLPNLAWIYYIWHPSTSNDRKRWKGVACSVFLYTIPMIFRRDYKNFLGCLFSLCSAGACFLCVDGWGHALFHAMMGPFAYFLSSSVHV